MFSTLLEQSRHLADETVHISLIRIPKHTEAKRQQHSEPGQH